MGRGIESRAAFVAGGVILIVAVACNALTGADDLVEAKTGLESSGGLDGAPGTPGSTLDGAVDPNITASLESCGEGHICLPTTTGWTPTILLPDEQPCPGAWPTRSDFIRPTGGDCACSCTPSGGSCASDLRVTTGGCGGSTQDIPSGGGDGSCEGPSPIAIPFPASLSARAQNPPSCTPSATPRLTQERAVVCGGAAPKDAIACRRQESCVPLSGVAGGKSCIIHDGDVPCPGGFSIRQIIGAAAGDQRACGACKCKASCGTATVYGNGSCSGGGRTIEVDGTCQSGSALNATSVKYDATNGCAVDGATTAVTGGFAEPKTICCVDR